MAQFPIFGNSHIRSGTAGAADPFERFRQISSFPQPFLGYRAGLDRSPDQDNLATDLPDGQSDCCKFVALLG
ncbi:hypothetical protein [Bradyrhizobium sp. STM 3809]|uniref:hypothetical protein n=1 Tax=Bradyrhizobium sp. STM 3809 TaxID=551936 RepID=UPI0014795079|nr:hypothetical protein [Bradyrhizobium sp. STM 3809]